MVLTLFAISSFIISTLSPTPTSPGKKFENAYNNELANDLGNLVQRLATLCKKNQITYQPTTSGARPFEYCQFMDNFEFNRLLT